MTAPRPPVGDAGGYVDTVVEGETGVFFEQPEPPVIASAIRAVLGKNWSVQTLERHAAAFSEERFIERLRAVVASAADEGQAARG